MFQVIHAVLSGDDAAFATLVEKYQKSVHALAWRKIGDFHYAEENYARYLPPGVSESFNAQKSQSVFLGGSMSLRIGFVCIGCAKKKPAKRVQSLEETPMEEVEKSAYARYVLEERETQATETSF